MDLEIIKEKLAASSREEIEEYCLKLIQEKAEVQSDLQTTGKCLTGLLKGIGLMDDNLKINTEISVIAGKVSTLMGTAMVRPSVLEKKFGFLVEAEPLLAKYEHILK